MVIAPVAHAGTIGSWTPVTEPGNSNILRIGLYRTGDGILHAVWAQPNTSASGDDAVGHATITPGADVSGANSVVTGWLGTSDPDIPRAEGGSGLATVWGGLHSGSPSDPNNNASMATSDDFGAAWSLFPQDVVRRAAGQGVVRSRQQAHRAGRQRTA